MPEETKLQNSQELEKYKKALFMQLVLQDIQSLIEYLIFQLESKSNDDWWSINLEVFPLYKTFQFQKLTKFCNEEFK